MKKINVLLILILFFSQTYCLAAGGVKASWYDSESECWNNPHPRCPMANGESIYKAERAGKLFAAAWEIPFGEKVRVCNRANGKCVVVEITDRGPARRLKRGIDLCKLAFSRIEDPDKGVIVVDMQVIS